MKGFVLRQMSIMYNGMTMSLEHGNSKSATFLCQYCLPKHVQRLDHYYNTLTRAQARGKTKNIYTGSFTT